MERKINELKRKKNVLIYKIVFFLLFRGFNLIELIHFYVKYW